MAAAKKLEVDSKYNQVDLNNDGVVSDAEIFIVTAGLIDIPVGTKADVPGLILIGFSINAIISIPDEPLVLYFGSFTFGSSLLTRTLTIN